MSLTSSTFDGLHEAVGTRGFAFVEGAAMRDILAPFGGVPDWDAFAESWNRLELDTYMADGGRYRKRRHATFRAPVSGAITRQPHQAHYQSLDYNPVNGGIERWFEPGSELLVVRDTEEAVAAYRALLDDPGQAEQLGRRARERVLDEHTYRHRARRLLDLIGIGARAHGD